MTFLEALTRIFAEGIFPASLLGFIAYEGTRGYQDYWKAYLASNHIKIVLISVFVYALIISLVCSLTSIMSGANWFHALIFGFTFPSTAAEMQQKLRKIGGPEMGGSGPSNVSADDSQIVPVPFSQQVRKAFLQAVSLPLSN